MSFCRTTYLMLALIIVFLPALFITEDIPIPCLKDVLVQGIVIPHGKVHTTVIISIIFFLLSFIFVVFILLFCAGRRRDSAPPSGFVRYELGYRTALTRLRYRWSQYWHMDYQIHSMMKLIKAPHMKKVRLLSQYRGSRKSYTMKNACDRFYLFRKPIYINSLGDVEKCIGSDWSFLYFIAKHWLRVQDLLTLGASGATSLGFSGYLYTKVKDYPWLAFFIEKTNDTKPLYLYATLALCFILGLIIFGCFIRLRINVFVVDDVFATGSTKIKVQEVLGTLRTRAEKGFNVIIVSSNEGINRCFGDINSTVKETEKFPPPNEMVLHDALWQALYDETLAKKDKETTIKPPTSFRCPTRDIISATRSVLPEHVAMSMRLWTWVGNDDDRVRLMEALLQPNPTLTAPQVALLADLTMELDLACQKPCSEEALIRCPSYNNINNHPYGIKVKKTPTPRRLVMASALIEYYAAVEELMLLQLFIDALTEDQPAVDDVLALVSKVNGKLTGLERIKMNAVEKRWKAHVDKTCQELKDSIIGRRRTVMWAVLPQPTVDEACPTILDDLYNQLPVSTKPVIHYLRKASVPLYLSISDMLGNDNDDDNDNDHNNSSEQSNA